MKYLLRRFKCLMLGHDRFTFFQQLAACGRCGLIWDENALPRHHV